MSVGIATLHGQLVRYHARRVMEVGKATEEELVETIGIAQIMDGVPACWEARLVIEQMEIAPRDGLM